MSFSSLQYWVIRFLSLGLLGFLVTLSAFGQIQKVSVSFEPLINNEVLDKPKKFVFPNTNDTLHIDNLSWYVGNIQLLYQSKVVWKDPQAYHLIVLEQAPSKTLVFPIQKGIKFDAIAFSIGVDSLTNVSGAMGGDLDPTKGMYWTWQNGYINFKLEGRSNRCTSKDHSFTFHLGGYQKPYSPYQIVFLPVPLKEQISIQMDVGKWLENIDLSKHHHSMSPGEEGFTLSAFLPSIFFAR